MRLLNFDIDTLHLQLDANKTTNIPKEDYPTYFNIGKPVLNSVFYRVFLDESTPLDLTSTENLYHNGYGVDLRHGEVVLYRSEDVNIQYNLLQTGVFDASGEVLISSALLHFSDPALIQQVKLVGAGYRTTAEGEKGIVLLLVVPKSKGITYEVDGLHFSSEKGHLVDPIKTSITLDAISLFRTLVILK